MKQANLFCIMKRWLLVPAPPHGA